MSGVRKRNVLTAAEIAESINAAILGDDTRTVGGVEVIERATANELAFVGATKQLKRVGDSEAKVILVPQVNVAELEPYSDRTFLIVEDPEGSFLEVAQALYPERLRSQVGISPLATVAASAVIGAKTNIHPHAVIGEHVSIGEQCDIAPGVVIGDGCVLGDNVTLDANTVLYPDVTLGSDIHIKSSSVVGGDGFGYRTINGQHKRLPHVGSVHIHDNVQIGACTTIDRAKVGDTVIGSGTRIDNLVMIAHNCKVGEHNLLVGQSGLAGTVTTGSYVVCAGQAGIADHVHLGDQAMIGAQAGVHRDMQGGAAYLGTPAIPAPEHARCQSALRRVPELRSTVKQLTKQMDAVQEQIRQLLAAANTQESHRKAA